ncbi:Segregation and condensation protein B [hydrothermal vent metagenome]|uniref:Segregation and condensation protein B n=1 Tax=hydrothermal vent metagenome TaxID=652676 RepID=A0A3B0RTR8_9ZZZZ
MTELARMLEAILFVADEPISTVELAQVLDEPTDTVTEALEELAEELSGGHGLILKQAGSGWRLYTHEDAVAYLERYASTDRAKRLSNAAMETLAVVAYKQPVSRGQVSEIRGVDSDHALRTLERRELIHEVARAPGPGQAVLYGTTMLFLEKMGITAVSDLPPLADHVPPATIMETLEMPMRPESSSNDSTS